MKKQYGLVIALIGLALTMVGCAGTTTTTKDDTIQPAATTPVQAASASNGQSPVSAANAATGDSSQKSSSALQSTAFKAIYFGFDAATLSAEARTSLSETAKLMAGSKNPQALKIEGHCDERGSAEYNMALGEKRAQAAMAYLVSLGVSAERLSIVSFGKEQPADAGHDEQAWAKNRRDEFRPN